jgi:hypothetical protein
VIDWPLILPALVCAVSTYVIGHETMSLAARGGSMPWIGAVLTLAAAFSTLIAVAAVFP